MHEDLQLLVLAEATVQQILAALTDLQEKDSALDLPELLHDRVQVCDELWSFILTLELREDFLDLNEEARLIVGVLLHELELILVVLAVLVENLAYSDQFGQHGKLVRVAQLEVLLLVQEVQLQQVVAGEEAAELGLLLNRLLHRPDHLVVEQLLVELLCLHQHASLLAEFAPKVLKLGEHVPRALHILVVADWTIERVEDNLEPLDVDE